MTRSPPRATTHPRICSPGKTIFLNYVLVRLISARQVVLICDEYKTHLFYCGQVYSRSAGSGLEDLPECLQTQYFPIWALIDVDYQKQGPPFSRRSNIWPVQASSPNPVRWDAWRKQSQAYVLGMPLWNKEELVKGYVFSMFSLPAIDPGHAARWRFVADCPSPLLQFVSSARVQRLPGQAGGAP